MPRLNIEDDLDSDPRFHALIAKLGDVDRALGKIVRFWKCAQRYWGQEKTLVPVEIFKHGGWDVLLDVGLAVEREDGIYAKGAEDRFKWYLDQCRKTKALVEQRKNRARKERPRDAVVTTGSLPPHPKRPPPPLT
jgi:hypothetical protein